MRLPVVDPRDLFAVVPRALALLDEVGALIARIEVTRQEAAALIGRIELTREGAADVVARAQGMVDEAEPKVRAMATVAPDVHDLLGLVTDLVETLAKIPGLGGMKG